MGALNFQFDGWYRRSGMSTRLFFVLFVVLSSRYQSAWAWAWAYTNNITKILNLGKCEHKRSYKHGSCMNKANRHKSRAPSYKRQTDRRTDRPTDKAAYRVACTRLKIGVLLLCTMISPFTILKYFMNRIITTCLVEMPYPILIGKIITVLHHL